MDTPIRDFLYRFLSGLGGQAFFDAYCSFRLEEKDEIFEPNNRLN